jgi:hypothetical protein
MPLTSSYIRTPFRTRNRNKRFTSLLKDFLFRQFLPYDRYDSQASLPSRHGSAYSPFLFGT